MSRQDQYKVTATATRVINGVSVTRDLGTWDKLSGGEADSEETKYRPGGMADQVSLGGYRSIGNVTIEKLFKPATDLSLLKWLMNGVGEATIQATKTSLDVNKNPYGDPLVYKGIAKAVNPPDHDSESADAALWSVEISTDGTIS